MTPRVLCLLLLVVTAAPALSQALQLDVLSTQATHERLGNTLSGGGVSIRTVRSDRLAFRFGSEVSGSTTSALRSNCYGLIDPTMDCSPKPMQDRGRLWLATGGAELRLLTVGAVSLEAFGDLGFGQMRLKERPDPGDWRPPSSARILSAIAGAAIRVGLPLGLSARASVGQGSVTPVNTDYVIDGYSPFSHGFRTTRVSFGAIWTPRGRRP